MTLNEEGLALYREVSDALGVVACLTNIGLVMLDQDDYERSATLLREGLRLAWGLDHKLYIQYSIVGLAGVAASRAWPIRAARLWGIAEGMSETYGMHPRASGTAFAPTATGVTLVIYAGAGTLEEAGYEEHPRQYERD